MSYQTLDEHDRPIQLLAPSGVEHLTHICWYAGVPEHVRLSHRGLELSKADVQSSLACPSAGHEDFAPTCESLYEAFTIGAHQLGDGTER